MANLRYFYQLDTFHRPLPGSNLNLLKRPTSYGRSSWVEFSPLGHNQPCCTDGTFTVTSIGKKDRYYIRVDEAKNLPIAGSLFKAHFAPKAFPTQEVIRHSQCATTPQWGITAAWTGTSPKVFHLATQLNLPSSTYTFVAASGATTGAHMTYALLTNGTLTITQNSASTSHTDTINLKYTNGTCEFMFKVTLVFTHS